MANVRGCIVQITNISPSCSLEQIRTLFGNIGVIEELVLYPPEGNDCPSKVCYIRYADEINAEVALHLHNTMFLDRALIVLPVVNGNGSIPDEKYANLVRAPMHTSAGIHPRSASWPLDVINMTVGRPGEQVIQTIDPRLLAQGFPVYPPLPAATDCNRIEEIRRTVLVTNLDPKVTGEQVLEFFNAHAEVKCVRLAGTDSERAAYVEFTEQPSILKAFGLMGGTIGDRQIMVQHSSCAIIKPPSSLPGIDDTVRRTSPPRNPLLRGSSRLRSRSRSRSRRRRSPSRSRRRRSRGRRDRTVSRSRAHRSRSRSRDRKRGSRETSRSRGRRSKRTRSPSGRANRRRSRSRSHRRRSRERRDRERRERHERNRSKDKDRERRRSRSKHRRSRSKDKEVISSSRLGSTLKENRKDSSKNGSRDGKIKEKRSESRKSAETGAKERSASRRCTEMVSKNGNKSKTPKNEVEELEVAEQKPVKENVNGNSRETIDPFVSKKPVGVKLAGPDDIEG